MNKIPDPKAVLGGLDKSGLAMLQGQLSKRASHGAWQPRYFCVNRQYLNYFASQKMQELKGSGDLVVLAEDPMLLGRFGEFQLVFEGGDVVRLKAKNLKEATDWVHGLVERRHYYLHGDDESNLNSGNPVVAEKKVVDSAPRPPQQAPAPLPLQTPQTAQAAQAAQAQAQAAPQRAPGSPLSSSLSSKGPRALGLGSKTKSSSAEHIRDTEWERHAAAHCSRAGVLQKRSPSRFKAWQQRHFRLVESALLYYKSDKSSFSNFQGRIALDRAAHVVAVGDGELHITTPFRTYALKAPSDALMNEWVQVLARACECAAKDAEEPDADGAEELEEDKVPEWILEWDEMDPIERREQMEAKLERKFAPASPAAPGSASAPSPAPPRTPGSPSPSGQQLRQQAEHDVEATIAVATGLIEELDELAQECLGMAAPRPDIVIEYIRCYHVRLEHELGYFMVGDQFEELSIMQMLRLMDLITAYGDLFDKLLDGSEEKRASQRRGSQVHVPASTLPKLRDGLPPFSMADKVEKMAARYVCEMRDALGTWVENIVNSIVSRGPQSVEPVAQGSTLLCTSAPVDIFNFVNETLAAAKASGVEPLLGAVLWYCLVAVADYGINLLQDVRGTDKGRLAAKDLRFLCAVTNDLSAVIDHVDALEAGEWGKLEGIVVDWEQLRTRYDQLAIDFLEQILAMIRSDLTALYQQLFTPEHLQVGSDNIAANVVARIAATVQDYLDDIRILLIPAYFFKLIKMLVREVVLTYCSRFVALTNVPGAAEQLVNEVLKGAGAGAASSASLPLSAGYRLDIDDVYHMRADREGLLATLAHFVQRDFVQRDDVPVLAASGATAAAAAAAAASPAVTRAASPTALMVTAPHAAEKFFATEFMVLDHIIDLLAVSPQFFISAVVKIVSDGATKAVRPPVVATALACLASRADLSLAQSNEIRHQLCASLREATIASNVLEGLSASASAPPEDYNFSHVYYRLWPSLALSKSLSSKIGGMAARARQHAAENKSPAGPQSSPPGSPKPPAQHKQQQQQPQPHPQPQLQLQKQVRGAGVLAGALAPSPSAQARRGSSAFVPDAAEADLSEQGAMIRKQQRHGKMDVTEDIRDVDLHGYLDKRSPHSPYPWQQRWFLVHKAYNGEADQWKMALSWHKNHSSPIKSRLFLDQIERIELVSNLPVRLAADGLSLVLQKGKVVATDTHYEFRVVTEQRSFSLRSSSMSETVSWVNGLNKACREARRMATVLETTTVEEQRRHSQAVYENLDNTQLRSLCASKGLGVGPAASRGELIQALDEASKRKEDKHAAAESVSLEEKKRRLLTKTVKELREACKASGIDDSKVMDKSELVTLLAAPVSKGGVAIKESREEQEAHLRSLVARGLMLLEEEEDTIGSGGAAGHGANTESAIGIFECVIRDAGEAGLQLVEARAMNGLATAYGQSDSRREAAPMMFEMAAGIFLAANEKSDAKTCAMDASELYRILGQFDNAIRVLVSYDTSTRSLEFAQHIERLRVEQHRALHPQQAKPAAKAGRSAFSSIFSL